MSLPRISGTVTITLPVQIGAVTISGACPECGSNMVKASGSLTNSRVIVVCFGCGIERATVEL
jgi:ssDNA-binding Zn-finger/Zn-ribbon topoisomerase 1